MCVLSCLVYKLTPHGYHILDVHHFYSCYFPFPLPACLLACLLPSSFLLFCSPSLLLSPFSFLLSPSPPECYTLLHSTASDNLFLSDIKTTFHSACLLPSLAWWVEWVDASKTRPPSRLVSAVSLSHCLVVSFGRSLAPTPRPLPVVFVKFTFSVCVFVSTSAYYVCTVLFIYLLFFLARYLSLSLSCHLYLSHLFGVSLP